MPFNGAAAPAPRSWAEVRWLTMTGRLAEECFPLVVLDAREDNKDSDDTARREHIIELGSTPCVVIGRDPDDARRGMDVLARDDDELAEIVETTQRFPLAATALAVLLRGQVGRSVEDGLAAESAVYSTLQGGPEFGAWLSTRRRVPPIEDGPTVLAERDGSTLTVTLHRPHRHNAVSRALRDELVDALGVALSDDSIRAVVLRGAGRSFCSGGDLDEFGGFPDPATAHAVRLTRSPARAIAALAARTTTHLHGACIGAGIEWAAFTGRVVASPATRIALPEVGFGLVPGAGGTVSLTRRIGRERTAWLALTRRTVDAPTALSWGLVDEIL
jgi:enoyl-CoA hydratase